MNQPTETTTTNCLIVGAGALGLLLAYALERSSQENHKPTRVLLHNRTPLVNCIDFELATGNKTKVQFAVETTSPTQFLAKVNPEIIFICVPPESTESVFLDWLNALESPATSKKSVLFVFCNNGCLSARTLERISCAGSQFSFIRALFFVGAIREKNPTGCLVRWTGGSRVIWNFLRTPSLEQISSPALIPGPFAQSPEQLAFMEWSQEKHIFQAERAKFFTNFMLAVGVGPKLAKNKTLSATLEDSIVSLQAEQFAILWEQLGVSADILKTTLQKTIQATGENINSLSLAAVHGNSNTMQSFFEFVAEEISASPRQSELAPMIQFLNAARTNWSSGK
jgi:ketopantoate reductase